MTSGFTLASGTFAIFDIDAFWSWDPPNGILCRQDEVKEIPVKEYHAQLQAAGSATMPPKFPASGAKTIYQGTYPTSPEADIHTPTSTLNGQ